jgi:hypothetical protein
MKLLILFNVIALLVAVHYLLITSGTPMFGTTMFYVVTWIGSLILIVWFTVAYGKETWLAWENDPSRKDFPTWVGALALIIVLSSLVPRLWTGLTVSSLYAPSPARTLAASGSTDWLSLASDVLFNFCLVANAEEPLKLTAHLALYKTTGSQVVSIILPIGGWAVLHAYRAYPGALMLPLVVTAFVSGIVIFMLMWRTGSLLNAVLVHGAFNSFLIAVAALFH